MAWKLLPTDYTDAVWDGLKKYSQINNADGTISLQDMTVYTNKEKSFFGALDANRMNEALNTIMSMVENGTNLYEAFQIYFAGQKELFEDKADTEYALFVKYLTDLETQGFTSLTAIANRAAASADEAKTSEGKAKASETASADSAAAAKDSENKAKASETASKAAQTAAETAKTGAETAAAGARQSAKDASDILNSNKEIAVRTPYVGANGNWFVWNNATRAYEDSGTQAQGIQGVQGIQGEKGEKGDRGIDGVAVTADGHFGFSVNADGHLILSYTGTDAPDFSVNAEGHLIYNF